MKTKRVGIAVLLAVMILSGMVWADRAVFPAIELAEKVVMKVVDQVSSDVDNLDPSEQTYSLLQKTTNYYRDEVERALLAEISPDLPARPDIPNLAGVPEQDLLKTLVGYVGNLRAYEKKVNEVEHEHSKTGTARLGEYVDRIVERMNIDPGAGLILSLPFLQDSVAARIEANGSTESFIPFLQKSLEFLRGSARTRLIAELLKMQKEEKDTSEFYEKHKPAYREITEYEWIARQEEKVGKIGIQMIARGAEELLKRLQQMQAKKRQFRPATPAAAAPAPAPAPAVAGAPTPAETEKPAPRSGGGKPALRGF